MNKWEILGIEPTHDVKIIRKRYSELVKLYHPEDQPEIYQQIVEAYQSALREARSNRTRQETVESEAVSIQQISEQEEETTNSAISSLDFESFESEGETEQEEITKPSLDFGDVHESDPLNETYKETATFPLNFETVNEDTSSQEVAASRNVLDFSDYLESEYLIRNAIESIVGNPDYTIEEQENLWKQLFNNYQDSLYFVKNVLEEMDVYIFNQADQFSIFILLLKYFVRDFKDWGYYYKLEFWREKIKETEKDEVSLENARKETEQFYASYLMCQKILDDFQTANQIRSWIEFFRHSYWSKMVLFQLNEEGYNIKSIPVLAYILDMIGQVKTNEDQKAYDELLAYFEELQADSEEPFDIHSYNLLNSSEVEEKLYLLLYSPYQDEYKLLRDWQYLFESVKDHTLLLDLLEKVDVYPLTNAKVLALVLQFVERYSDEESNPYLKKLHFWKSIHSYPSVVEEYALNKKENFDYWYNEGYLYIDKLTKSDEDINDWEKWISYFKGRPRILTILLQQIYKEYHRFTDGELLRYVLSPFPTSKMAPQMMTEETDQKLEEMTVYAYELSHPKAKLSYLDWKKRQVLKNKFLQFVFGLFSIVSLILSILERPGYNSWVHAGMFSLFYVYMLKLRKTPIEEGVTARGEKRKFYYSPHPWFLLILLLTLVIPSLPFGLIGALMFITFFSFIDGFQVSQGLKWDYSLDKLIPIGIFLSAGFLSALVNRSQTISGVAIAYFHIFAILVICLSFTRFSPGFPPSLKKIFIPAILGILLFQTLPYIHSRLDIFDPTILRDETLTITVILLLNGIALSYFTKEQGFMIGVKKVFMIYGLQIFIFLRRLLRILFAPNSVFGNNYHYKDLLIMNSEFTFYFLEGLFILIMLFLIRNIRKENRKSAV